MEKVSPDLTGFHHAGGNYKTGENEDDSPLLIFIYSSLIETNTETGRIILLSRTV